MKHFGSEDGEAWATLISAGVFSMLCLGDAPDGTKKTLCVGCMKVLYLMYYLSGPQSNIILVSVILFHFQMGNFSTL